LRAASVLSAAMDRNTVKSRLREAKRRAFEAGGGRDLLTSLPDELLDTIIADVRGTGPPLAMPASTNGGRRADPMLVAFCCKKTRASAYRVLGDVREERFGRHWAGSSPLSAYWAIARG